MAKCHLIFCSVPMLLMCESEMMGVRVGVQWASFSFKIRVWCTEQLTRSGAEFRPLVLSTPQLLALGLGKTWPLHLPVIRGGEDM